MTTVGIPGMRNLLLLLIALVPYGAGAQQQPYAPAWVPAKIIGYHKGPHNLDCTTYLPVDSFRQVQIVHAEFTVVVNADGTVKSVDVKEDSGKPEIASALTTCAMNWLFKPATIDGKPVESTTSNYETMQITNMSAIDVLNGLRPH